MVKKSRKAYTFFKKECLSERHYNRFKRMKICKKDTEVKFLDEYIVIRTKFYNLKYKDYYHGVAIVGIDDTTNKFFCHRLPWSLDFESNDFMEKVTVDYIKRFLGIRDGFERIQGDVIMRVKKLSFHELVEYFSNIIVSFSKIITTMKDVKAKLMEFYEHCRFKKSCKGISCRKTDELHREFPILKKLGVDSCDVFMFDNALRKRTINELKEIMLRKENEDLVLEALANVEKLCILHLGNHVIIFAGIPVSRYSTEFIIIREQDITFAHHEHGKVQVPIVDVPAIVEFDTLRHHGFT